jgi:hypothetical protein
MEEKTFWHKEKTLRSENNGIKRLLKTEGFSISEALTFRE